MLTPSRNGPYHPGCGVKSKKCGLPADGAVEMTGRMMPESPEVAR
jgi:hypothetical protein